MLSKCNLDYSLNQLFEKKEYPLARLERTTGSITKWLTLHFQEKVVKLRTVCSGQNIKDWSCIYSKWKLKINLNKELILVWYSTKTFARVLENRCMKQLSIWLLHFIVQLLYFKNYTVYPRFRNSLAVLWDWVYPFKVC